MLRRCYPLLLVGAIALAFCNSLNGPFILDDGRCIINNPDIRHLWPLNHTSRPVVQLSLAVNYAIGGLDVTDYHVVNLLLHVAAALTLFGLVRRSTDRDDLAFLIALLWAIHPLVTQPVNYIIQRGELLMSLFMLLTLYCLRREWLVLSILACALGMASKPIMAITPVIALLYDRAFMAGSFRAALQQRTKFYLGLAATWLVLPVVLLNGQQDWLGSAGMGVEGVSTQQYAMTQPSVILHYLRLAIWPRGLCLDYMWPPAKSLGLPVAIIAGLIALTVWACRRHPRIGFLAAAFFILLAPTSSFLPIDDLAFEHRMYLPLACLVALAVAGLQRYRLVLITIALALGVGTFERNKDYRNAVAIWTDTVAKSPQNYRAHTNLANALDEAGQLEQALVHARRAAEIEPRHAQVHYNLANILDEIGRSAEAAREYAIALDIYPDYALAHYKFGALLARQGNIPDAVHHLEDAVRLRPDMAKARKELERVRTRT